MKQSTDSDGASRPDPGSFSLTPVKLAEAKKIAALKGVETYSLSSSSAVEATDSITPISNSETNATTISDNQSESTDSQMPQPTGENGERQTMKQSDFQVTGVVSLAMATDFSSGTAKLVSGELITETDANSKSVVIDKTLASADDLSVGDTFRITSPTDASQTYELRIKGIYETSSSGDSMGMMFNFMISANTLDTSYTFANTLKGSTAADTIDSAVYNLEDSKEMPSFVKKAEQVIDMNTYSLQTNDQAYQQILQPVNNVASFAKNIGLLVAVAGVIILTLIVMLTIREQRYEIGVLLSLDESRVKIILQFFSEIIFCMVVALIIATFSGNVVRNIVGEQLIAQQTNSQSQTQTTQGAKAGQRPDGNEPNRGAKDAGGPGNRGIRS